MQRIAKVAIGRIRHGVCRQSGEEKGTVSSVWRVLRTGQLKGMYSILAVFKHLGNRQERPIKGVSSTVNAAGSEVNAVDPKTSIELPNDPNMPELKDIVYSDDDEDVGAEADINNLDTHIPVSPIPTTRIHKDHPVEQIIRDIYSAPQTRRMTKSVTEQAMFSSVQQRTNHKDFQNCLFTCFLSQEEPKKVTQGYTQEEGIDYDKVFAPVVRIEAIRLFLAYALFKDFMVYQMDVKSAFPYEKIEEEVYVCQPPGFEDPDFPDRVYKVEKGSLWFASSSQSLV
ncbi:putative ribonuclease H-like domain-containing protein [Tanacetum coccineum]|uniref:Ribonuclease H-like domain-containing protein n=1 Tax=Tanacetum coccineum TaxID=301880 RepID=A0ABQ5ALL8_9ASTR